MQKAKLNILTKLALPTKTFLPYSISMSAVLDKNNVVIVFLPPEASVEVENILQKPECQVDASVKSPAEDPNAGPR